MKTEFQLTWLDRALLIANAIAFGACVVLLLLGRTSGPLVLLTIGAAGMLVGKLGRASRPQSSESSLPPAEER